MKIYAFSILLLTSPFAHAFGVRDFGGSSAPNAFSIHDGVKAQAHATRIADQGQPPTPAFSTKVVTSTGRTDRGPLVVTSARFDVAFEVLDLSQRSRRYDVGQVTRWMLDGSIGRLVAKTFGPARGAPYARLNVGIEEWWIKRPSYIPQKNSLDYNGPLAVQMLARQELKSIAEVPELIEVAHQPVPFVGVTMRWWEPMPNGGMVGTSEVLRTFDSRDVDVRRGSTVTDFRIDLPDAFRAMLVNDARAILKGKSRREVARMKPHFEVHLLDQKFGTIAEYPLNRAINRRWVAQARAGRLVTLRQACVAAFR